jgi:hypothetical protein
VSDEYHHADGSLKWGFPIDVGHLILQLQTLDPRMKVSSVTFIDTPDGRRPRAYGLSMSRERWDAETGWLDYTLKTPECLGIWATVREDNAALSPLRAATPGPRKTNES